MFNQRVAILHWQRGQIGSCSLKAPNWLFPSCCLLVIQAFQVYFRAWANTMTVSSKGADCATAALQFIAVAWPKLIASSLFFLELALASGHFVGEYKNRWPVFEMRYWFKGTGILRKKNMAGVNPNDLLGHICKLSVLMQQFKGRKGENLR